MNQIHATISAPNSSLEVYGKSIDTSSILLPPLRHLGRVGILGGSFNPPHIGHASLALAAYQHLELDHLWVMPCADHPFGKHLAPFADRVRMCLLTFRHFSGGVAVIDMEKHLPTPSFTAQTLAVLHQLRPGIKPILIGGSDLIDELPRWQRPKEVTRLCSIRFFTRSGHNHENAIPLPYALPEMSSSAIRERIVRRESIERFVDQEVDAYLESTSLYKI